ncbi:MAG: DUF5916 domain-containing protein [Bacteroidia bacterium]
MRKRKTWLLAISLGACMGLWAQVTVPVGTVELDGRLNEEVWTQTPFQEGFIQHYPYDTSRAESETRFAFAIDDKNFYAAFVCLDRNPEKPFVVQSLKRDFSVKNTDAVILTLSPFLDGQNGFSFGVSPYNSQREGSVENGGNFGVTTAWDQVWFSETQINQGWFHSDTAQHKHYWVAEMAIPLHSIRFVPGSTQWAFNVVRLDLKNNEESTWIKVPRNLNVSVLTLVDTLEFQTPMHERSRNNVLIPYVSWLTQQNVQESWTGSPRLGLDAKMALTPSLNADLTFNPDFAQVDVDVQQLNLTRFNLFFPERRQFFTENSDLFATFGFRQIRPFFSRRIGLGPNGYLPIDAGAKVTGKLGNDWRVGLMSVRTRGDAGQSLNAEMSSVMSLQRKVLKASSVGFIAVDNRMAGGQGITETPSLSKYASIVGTEFNYANQPATWVGKAFVQKSLYEDVAAKSWAHASFLRYRSLNWTAMWNHEHVGKDFRAPLGFVPRLENFDPTTGKVYHMDFTRLEPSLVYTHYIKGAWADWLNHMEFGWYNSTYYDSALDLTEGLNRFFWEWHFQNSATIELGMEQEAYNLFLPFQPVDLPNGGYFFGQYQWWNQSISVESNSRKPFNWLFDYNRGGYFVGNKRDFSMEAGYRIQPRWNAQLSYRNIDLDMRDSGRQQLNLIGFKTEYSFSTILYSTAYVQYNTQAENVNLNLRLQYRYRPMSDFFVVYSQNYDPYLQSKNRSFAVKFVRWI